MVLAQQLHVVVPCLDHRQTPPLTPRMGDGYSWDYKPALPPQLEHSASRRAGPAPSVCIFRPPPLHRRFTGLGRTVLGKGIYWRHAYRHLTAEAILQSRSILSSSLAPEFVRPMGSKHTFSRPTSTCILSMSPWSITGPP